MKLVTLFIASLISAGGVMAQDHKKRDEHQMHQLHGDPKAYIAMLEDPARDAYQKPDQVIEALGIKEGLVVADIGSGSGYFSVRFADKVGATGRVYAVDIDPDMAVFLNRRIRDLGLTNIQSVLAAPDDPLLADNSVDRFFICNTWHHIEDQEGYLRLMKRMLKPGGQIIMMDFHKKQLPVGPPLQMKIARADLVQQMQSNGFALLQEHTFLPYQYLLVFGVQP